MTEREAKLAASLCDALAELPRARRALSTKPGKYWDCVWLGMQASQMQDGVSQSSDAYFELPPAIGRKVFDAAERIIREELKRLKVTPVSRPTRGAV